MRPAQIAQLSINEGPETRQLGRTEQRAATLMPTPSGSGQVGVRDGGAHLFVRAHITTLCGLIKVIYPLRRAWRKARTLEHT